jgi:steroid 5-alpha reductase family enzyme
MPICLALGAEYDREVIEETWLLFLLGAAAASVLMVALWFVQLRIGNASHVDVGWAYGIVGLALLYALLGDGRVTQRVLVAGLGAVWGMRLGTYVLARVVGHEEDGRYKELRRRWAPHTQRNFFVFFQAQAGFVAVFSLPFLFVAQDGGDPSPLLWLGAALALVSVAGETTADAQLAVWKASPENKGKTARNGLWGWSRHPNYFFEWLHWVGWAVAALGSPHGWIALAVPAFLLLLLFRVTGIPETEAQALRSRDDYRHYQQEVSVFVPRPPKRRTA